MKKAAPVMVFFILSILLALITAGFYLRRHDVFQGCLNQFFSDSIGCKVEMTRPWMDGCLKRARIDRLKLLNPSGYKGPVFAELTNVELECDFSGLMLGQGIHCRSLKAVIEEINLERHPSNRLNLREWKVFSEEILNRSGVLPGFLIDRCEFTYKKAGMDEYLSGKDAQRTEVHFDDRAEVYSHVRDPAILIYAPVLKIIPEFKRGNLGIPRTVLQKKLLAGEN